MINKVIVKIDMSMPYGGGIDKAIRIDIPVIKIVGSNVMFTVNRSPHGNKTARDQFKINGIKYTTVAIFSTINGVESLLNYIDNSCQVQGINNIDVMTSFDYNKYYSLNIIKMKRS